MIAHTTEIIISWKKNNSQEGWGIDKSGEEFFFNAKTLKRVPGNLRDKKIEERFFKIFSKNEAFKSYWWQKCGGDTPRFKHFVLQFPDEVWNIPWELLIKILRPQYRPYIVLSRSFPGSTKPYAPIKFDEPLRILIAKGDDGSAIGVKLNLDREVKQIIKSWQQLDHELKQCITEPKVEKVTRDNFDGLLEQHRPHILWYSGHGRAKPSSGLLLADGQWLDASDFALLIEKSQFRPLYYVFWACDIGKKTQYTKDIEDRQNFPGMFKELQRVNVLAMLAMQAPIRDSSAVFMTRAFFEALTIGLPLERALAQTRSIMLNEMTPGASGIAGAHPLDWASPVVWNNGNVVDKWEWNSSKQKTATFQVFGRKALRSSLTRPDILESELTLSELQKAKFWLKHQRIWVYWEKEGFENNVYWTRTLQSIQYISGKFILAITLRDKTALDKELQDWAKKIIDHVTSVYIPAEIVDILKFVAEAPISGWKSLCKLPNLFLAIENPPDGYGNLENLWFWEPLRDETSSIHIAVLSSSEIELAIRDLWQIEKIQPQEGQYTLEKISITTESAPQLVHTLAVLDMPMEKYYIQAAELLTCQWKEIESIFIETTAGPLITSYARHLLLQKLTPEELQQAHVNCFRVLDHPSMRLTNEIREKRLYHLLGAKIKLQEKAIYEAEELLKTYRNENRPYAAMRVYKLVGDTLAILLRPTAKLCVAWSHAQLGNMLAARLWLTKTNPSDPVEIAWKHGLMAEIYKSQAEVEMAINVLNDYLKTLGTSDPKANFVQYRLRSYRQDKARILQYLFYRTKEAAEEYGKLIKEWSGQPEAEYDLAVVKRNYAECLREQAAGPEDSLWLQANALFREAESITEEKFIHAPVRADILFELAKTYEQENNLPRAQQTLQLCIKTAVESHYFMVAAIAESEFFWKYESFIFPRWREIEQKLTAYPFHGWAVRTLINGRIRCAQKLFKEKKDLQTALEQLKTNRELIKKNPAFDGRGDKRRTAVTYAGLQTISLHLNQPGSYWEEFLALDWAQDWLIKKNNKPVKNIWEEVI
jgi:hypothetical protein